MYYARPQIVISTCLGLAPVRYDGNIIFDEQVERLKKFVNFIGVCPEVGIGLGVPRNPLVLVAKSNGIKLVDTIKGGDYTEALVRFAEKFSNDLPEIDGFILKSASPSCGVKDAKIYDEHRRVVGKSDGLFTTYIRERFKNLPVESEKRLSNAHIRRNFYTKIFTIAYIRETLERARDLDDIVSMHRSLKYTLMLFHPGMLKHLGRLVANRSSMGIEKLKKEYREIVLRALVRNPTYKSYYSVFLHLYGHLKNDLSDGERRYVLKLLEDLKNEKIDVKVVMSYFKGFMYRFTDEYLSEQRFLQPYPDDLD